MIVALDCSRSMLVRDLPPSRFVRARHEIVQLLEHIVLPLFQFLQELSRLAVGSLRGGSRRHGLILGRR